MATAAQTMTPRIILRTIMCALLTLTASWFEGAAQQRDCALPRFGRDAASEVDELLEGVSLGKPVGHSAGAPAAEDEDFDAEARKAVERLGNVRHLLRAIDRSAGHLQRRRKKEVRRGR